MSYLVWFFFVFGLYSSIFYEVFVILKNLICFINFKDFLLVVKQGAKSVNILFLDEVLRRFFMVLF